MMKIRYEYVRSDDVINYVFKDDIITAEHVEYNLILGVEENDPTHLVEVGRHEDKFDFTGMLNGELQVHDGDTGEILIETLLPENPITSAKRADGELWIVLVMFFGGNEIDDERNLDWFDAKEVESDG